ncbi:MAG: methylenetetrahydrofolate reductase [Streptosporangiales bacterium]
MRNGYIARPEVVSRLLESPRYEVIPTSGVADRVLEHLPLDVTVAITASPVKGLGPTLDLAGRLAVEGYHVVPHVTARLVSDDAHLNDIVARLRAAGIDEIFVPAGDADPPAGQFTASLDVLRRLTALGDPFSRVGITGYPETHPAIDDDLTVQAMWDKRMYANYVVSNLCFDPAALTSWVGRVRRRGVGLPIYIGLAGPVERTKLLSIASKIGVGESTRFLGKHASWFLHMAGPGGYTPERFLHRAAPALEKANSPAAGLHIYTFNQIAETERWRQRLLGRDESADRTRRPARLAG